MMNFMRLLTASGVPQQIDLSPYATYRQLPDSIYDAMPENIIGEESVLTRRIRRNFELDCDGIPAADLQILRALYSSRAEVYFEPNAGRYTCLYAPLERSLTPHIGSAGAFTRATAASYYDSGLILPAVSGAARYQDAQLGKGILIEGARTNYFFPSHGSSGNTVWSTSAGSPSVSWDASVASNVYGQAGSVKIAMPTAGDAVKKTVAGLTGSTAYCTTVWLRGVGRVALQAVGSVGGTTAATLTLAMDWQAVSIEYFTTNSGITTVDITILATQANAVAWVSACQVEAGMTATSYIPTTANAATRNQDQLTFAAAMNVGEGSIAFWVSHPYMPLADSYRSLWRINAEFWAGYTPSDNKVQFGVSSTNFIAGLVTAMPDDPVHLAFVWKRDFVAVVANGVTVTSTTNNGRTALDMSTLYLWHAYQSSWSANTIIDDLRVDNRYVEWRTANGGEYPKYTDGHNAELLRMTQGRRFRIKGANFKPKDANPGYFEGTMQLKETYSDENSTIEVA